MKNERKERVYILVYAIATVIMGALLASSYMRAMSYKEEYYNALKRAKEYVVENYEPGVETDRILVLGGTLGYEYEILGANGVLLDVIKINDDSEFKEYVDAAIRAEREEEHAAVGVALSIFIGGFFAFLLIASFTCFIACKVQKILHS